MKKSTRNICIISGILFEPAILYLIGATLLPAYGLEYRFWVDSLGKVLCMIAIPLWIAGLAIWKLWQIFRENKVAGLLVRLAGAVSAIVFLIWCVLACLIIALSTNEESYLGGGMLSVMVQGYPQPTSYDIYESVGLFFRRDSSLTPEAVIKFLEEKYKRDFFPVEADGTILYSDMERPDVKAEVKFIGGRIQEDYPQALADYYLQEGWQTLDLSRKYRFIEVDTDRERFCLILNGNGDCAAFAEDAYNLIQYALKQDSLLEKQNVYLFYSAVGYEDDYRRLRFGSHKSWEDLSSRDYGTELAKVTQHIVWEYSSIRLKALNESSEPTSESTPAPTLRPAPEPTPPKTDREIAEAAYPGQCEAAEAIWNAELKDLGYDYEPDLNAKGNLIIRLGKLPSENLQSLSDESDYYLTYDRESKNGNCYLFVLSEVPEGHGLNDAYLREFYACEKVTLKVVAGNKTSWGQPGCAEYRNITGE